MRSAPLPEDGPGALLEGVIEYVGNTFIKVRSGGTVAIVFRSELADVRVDNPSDIVSQGDHVFFVLLERSTKKPGEWIASLAAADEARMRARMRSLHEGAELSSLILNIKDKGVELDCEGVRGWAPLDELSHAWVDHPADCVRLGETHRVRVKRLECPNDWLEHKRARSARLIVSLKACLPPPTSPLIEMPFRALPFQLSAQVRKPRACDAVALYVLEELDFGVTLGVIGEATGFPILTLQAILRVLEAESLVRRGELTPRGSRLVEAIRRARHMNEAAPRGLFVSAAPLTSMFVSRELSTDSRRYPAVWPSPPFNPKAERRFLGETDEALPQALIDSVTDEPMRATVLNLLQDTDLRVFLRRDTESGARRVVYLPVPEHWVLAGLWSVLLPVGTSPYRPASLNHRCRDFLLVRVRVPSSKPDGLPTDFYYEPVSVTYWTHRPDVTLNLRELSETEFPKMPMLPMQCDTKDNEEGTGYASVAADAATYERRWCRVRI